MLVSSKESIISIEEGQSAGHRDAKAIGGKFSIVVNDQGEPALGDIISDNVEFLGQ